MIGIDSLVYVILFILVVGVIGGLLWWLIGYAERNGLPPTAVKVARIVFVVACVLVAISLLLGLIGHPVVRL